MDKEKLIERIDQLPLFVKEPLFKEGDDQVDVLLKGGKFIEQRNLFGIFEENSDQAICAVSKRYQLVQLKSVFKPTLEEFEEVDGRVAYYNGYAIMDLFPVSKDQYKDIYKEGNHRIGLAVTNSVDKSSAVSIRFCIKYDKTKVITIPRKIAGFYRVHSNRNVLNLTNNYVNSIAKVRTAWKTIVTKFPKYELDAQDLKDMMVDLDFGDNISSYLKGQFFRAIADSKKFSLWDFFNSAMTYVSSRNYLSEIHKRKKLDQIVEKIITYSFNLNLAI